MSDEALPGTVFTPRQVKLLKITVIALGILLLGGFFFVVAAIVYQASRLGQDHAAVRAQARGEGEFQMPPGAAVRSMTLDGNHLAMQLGGAAGDEVVVLDVRDGRVLSRIRLLSPRP